MDSTESQSIKTTKSEQTNMKNHYKGDGSASKNSLNDPKHPLSSKIKTQTQDSVSREHENVIQDANSAESKPNEINFKKKYIPYFQRNKPEWIKYEENQSLDHLKFELFEAENRKLGNSESSFENFEIVEAQHARELLQSEKERIKTYRIHLEENYIPTFWPPRIWDRDYIRLSCEESNRLSNSIEIARRPPLKPLYFPHPNELPIWSIKSNNNVSHDGKSQRQENNDYKLENNYPKDQKKKNANKEIDVCSSRSALKTDNSIISSPSLGISVFSTDASTEIAEVEDV